MSAQKFYSTTKIKKLKADYNIIWGEKNTGKSYAVKKECLMDALNDPARHKLIVLRRYEQDIATVRDCEDYFIDPNFNIEKLSEGRYTTLKVKGSSKIIYGAFRDEATGKLILGDELGRFCALSTAEHYASKLRQGYSNIIFEEFQTRSSYLFNEPHHLMVFVSTVFGNLQGRVWLLGNAVSPICPYYSEWGLSNIVDRQAQGSIEHIKHTWTDGLGSEHVTKIAVERTAEYGAKSSMVFGKASKIVSGGQYESVERPHLLLPIHHYVELYTIVYKFNEHMFLLKYLLSPNNALIWFVEPKTSEYKGGRIISNLPIDSPLWTQGFNPLDEAEKEMFKHINLGHIAFASNLAGDNFIQCYRQSMRERSISI